MTLEIPWLLLGMKLGLDATTRIFLALTLLLWLLAAIYAAGYLAADPRKRRFWVFFAATFIGNAGLVISRDAASFYLFFALMTFAAYGLVVHAGDAAARRAGRIYIVLAVLGEAFLLGGLLIAAAAADGLELETVRAAIAASPSRDTIAALLIVGFGVKAGLLGLHVWLPLAHPVAPAPASAVLSGAMIKAGLLGWIQFLPLGEAALPGWGAALAAAGIAAIFYGAIVGVMQDDAKTVLAYSSVSQMGFMSVALAAGLAQPAHAGAAVAAAALYALHHGLAKGALFLGAGIKPQPRERLLFAALAAPGFVIAGLPFTSGAGAKHAIKAALGDWHDLGLVLSLGAIGTTLLIARFLVLAAQESGKKEKPPKENETQTERKAPQRLALGAWLACVAASLAAVSFAPAFPSFDDLWPFLAGLTLAALAYWPAAPWRRWRIPPGDLLLPASAATRALIRPLHSGVMALEHEGRRAFSAAYQRWHALAARWAQLAARGENRLGPAASLFILALIALLAVYP